MPIRIAGTTPCDILSRLATVDPTTRLLYRRTELNQVLCAHGPLDELARGFPPDSISRCRRSISLTVSPISLAPHSSYSASSNEPRACQLSTRHVSCQSSPNPGSVERHTLLCRPPAHLLESPEAAVLLPAAFVVRSKRASMPSP